MAIWRQAYIGQVHGQWAGPLVDSRRRTYCAVCATLTTGDVGVDFTGVNNRSCAWPVHSCARALRVFVYKLRRSTRAIICELSDPYVPCIFACVDDGRELASVRSTPHVSRNGVRTRQ